MAQKYYEVTKPLLNRETNEETGVGEIIKMDPELAEVFLRVGALKPTRKKTTTTPEEE